MSDAVKELQKVRDSLDAYEANMKQQTDQIFDQLEKMRTDWRRRIQSKVNK